MKKKLVLVIFCFALHIGAFGQNLSQLDLKYGLKKFKFSTSETLYKGLLKPSVDTYNSPHVRSYSYQGTDIGELFGNAIKSVTLNYYKNKLFSITLTFYEQIFTESEYEKVLYSMQQAFGTGKTVNVSDGALIGYGNKWIGKKEELELIRIRTYKGENISGGYVLAVEPIIQRQVLADEL